ncbi:MAG: MFS transporter, partial [Olsenella sp.]
FLIGLKTLPNRPPEHPGTLDVPGSVLLFSSLVLVVGSVTLMQQRVGAVEIAALVVGLLLLVVFVYVERRCDDPVFPLHALRNRILILNMVTLFAMFFIIGGQNLLLPFFLQDARGMTAMQSALIMTSVPLVTCVMGPIAGAMSDRIGCYWPTSVGLGIVAVSELLLASLGLETAVPFIVVALVAYGLGDALFMAPNNSLIMGSASPDELGFIGGLAAFSRLFGQVSGLTFCTSVLYARMSAEVGYAVTDYIDGQPDVFIHSMSLVFVLLAIVIGVGFVATVMRFIAFRRELAEANED